MQLARLVGLCLLVANLGAIAAPPQRQAISPDLIDALESTVPCAQSPFGKASPVIRDLEPMVLHWGTGGTFFDEYTPATVGPPLTRVYRANLMQAPLPTETLRKSVSVDLNGDGRDEVVAAFSDGADVRVAVYSRTTGPTAQIIDTWSFSEQVDQYSVDIVAGDFDGSNDKQKEIALSWNIAGGNVRVVVLKGDASAHIVQADNATAGNFVTAQPSLGFPRLAVGDFLLAGRDQLILASYSTLAGSFVFHLLELDDGSNPTSEVPSPAMVPSGTAMRFNSFVHLTGAPNAFTIDDSPNIAMQTSGGIGVIEGLDAHGGDVVDTAAAELVLHVMFPEPVNPVSHVLVQRVLHFITTRNGSNQITGIQLGTVSFLGTSLNYADSTIMLERYTTEASNPYPPKFAVAVDDIDSVAYKEIVTARVGHDGAHGLSFGPLVWYAHKVGVRITPSFQWQNQGLDIGTNEPIVQFTNNSRGSISTYDWDFGDGSPHSSSINPAHRYNTTGTKTVTLTATAYDSTQFVYQHSVNVRNDGGSDANPQGDAPPLRIYRINPIAAFAPDQPASNPNTDLDTSAFYVYPTLGIDKTVVRIGVSDMDRDSLPEVVITVNNDGQAVDTHVFSRRAAADGTFRRKTLEDNVVGDTNVDLVMSDFDGDSLNAELSSTSGDCHAVTDVTIHSVTYFPPYFALLQTNSNRAARYGKSSSSSTSTEDRSASYISHDVTAYLGFGYEFSAPVLAVKLSEVEVKGNLGYNYQKTTGETHGDETVYAIDSGSSIGDDNQSQDQEGMLTTETTGSLCYQYYLVTAGHDKVNGSVMRACQTNTAPRTLSSPGARDWNRLSDELAGGFPLAVPIHWIPIQRDWASRALFHVPKSAAATGGAVTFLAAHGADKATDGLFSTSAESSSSALDKPYLEVDLGYSREIDSIRVFPKANDLPAASKPLDFTDSAKLQLLKGYRLYVSATPFAGNALPTAATSTTVVPGGISTFIQDVGDEESYRVWNVWTSNPATGLPIHGRFVRLQKRDSGKIAISEIQVFDDMHSEPPLFPDVVCDEVVGDGLFKALVYNPLGTPGNEYKVIELRGDMIWDGAVDYDVVTNVRQPSGVPGCENDVDAGVVNSTSPEIVRQEPILQDEEIGAAGSKDWSLSESHTHSQATDTSIDNSMHIGVEFEAQTGVAAHVITGASYEFSYGVTQENQSSQAYGVGFAVSGTTGGFDDTTLAPTCGYYPRPYAYRLTDTSNTGFHDAMYITDYVVRQIGRGLPVWQRGKLPGVCGPDDRIFANDFG